MRRVLIVALVLAAGCRRTPPPGATVEYRARDGSFTARLPSDWKADEEPGETRRASFYGPPSGDKPFSQLMGVYFHAAAAPAAAARAFLAADGAEVRVGAVGGALETSVESVVEDPHQGQQKTVTRTVAVPAAGGFFTLMHVYPAGVRPSPAFDELVGSFKPAAK